MSLRGGLARRPWIWVALLFVLAVLANVVLLILAERSAPVVAP